jgi:hypothetical protein
MSQNIQYQLENLTLWFQGGIRRGFLIFSGVCLVLIVPFYFLVTASISFWFQSKINPFRLDDSSYYQPKEIPQKEMIFSNTQVVSLKDGSKELYQSINNKSNLQVGYVPFVYDLAVLDAEGKLLKTETKSTYILPGEIRYIVYNAIETGASSLKLTRNEATKAVYYNPFSKSYKKPKISISGINFSVRSSTNILYINFVIKNNDQIKINKTDLLYTVRDSRESVVGIGEYLIDDLLAGEQREVSITYVQPLEREAKLINIDWSVNYLDAKNINLI